MTNLNRWPTLTRYDQDHLARIALPLGGHLRLKRFVLRGAGEAEFEDIE